MALLTQAAAERTIDRDFDQTALHNHAKDEPCPTCSPVQQFHDAPKFTGENAVAGSGNHFPAHLRKPFDRHVSPAVLEQRILDLEDQLRVANERIKAFEKFTANLAAHIDGMQQAVDQAINPKPSFPRAA